MSTEIGEKSESALDILSPQLQATYAEYLMLELRMSRLLYENLELRELLALRPTPPPGPPQTASIRETRGLWKKSIRAPVGAG